MAILFFLFPLLVSLACLAEIISLRSPSLSLSNPQFHPLSSADHPDLDLLDIVLVASVDGKFHALNRSSGHILWSMSSFPSSTSISTPSTLAPLVRTSHLDHDPDLTDDTTRQELYVIEPQSGDIYVMATPTSPLQRFPFSVPELVDMSPFSFSGDEDRRVFVGRKETSLLLMELETGKVKATLNSECPWDPFEDLHNDEEVDLDELEGSKPQMSTPTEVFIGRTGETTLVSNS
jgi:serine/threonine-protein kinase/endoribonuclease IRE1